MPFEVNTGTSADPLDGTEKMPVSQDNVARVVTTNEFFYLNASNLMFTDKAVNIDNGVGGALSFGNASTGGLQISVVDGAAATLGATVQFDILADDGRIANIAGSSSHLSWSSSGVTCTFRNAANSGVLIYDTDSSHKLRIAVGSNLTANRTFTLTTGNADRTLDISAGSVTISGFAITLLDDADAAAMQATLGLVIGTNVQAYDADLAALAANSTDGFWAHTGAGTGSARTLTAPAAGFTITNPAGIAGNPTFVLADDLAALEALTGTDTIYRRSAANTWSAVSFGTGLSFSGGTISLDSDLVTIAGLTATTDNFIVSVSSAWASRTPAQVRTTLGLGTAALKNTGQSGDAVPLCNGAATTWSSQQDGSGGFRATGVVTVLTGAGLEMYYESGEGKLLSYNRTGGVATPLNLLGSAYRVTLASLGNYANDAAAAAGGVAVGTLYRNGSVLMVRVA